MLDAVERAPASSGRGGGSRRHEIEGLRAVAVGLVVLGHCGVRTFAGGYVGVDVFFVISGFLITSLLLREADATGRVSIRGFYRRRALRLFPASTLALAATLAAAWAWLSPARFHAHVLDGLASAVYAVNFRLAATGTDYLAQGSPPSPFQHFWSLAVEEQFYLVWPLLILALRRRTLLVPALAVLCAVSFGLGAVQTGTSPPWAYFGTQARLWELGAGALLALTGTGRLRGAAAAVVSWTGLAAIVLAAVVFDAGTAFPGHLASLPVLGAVLVVAGGSAPRGAVVLLGTRPMVWLGGLSYGWYLWHWPFVLIGPEALGLEADAPLRLGLAAAALGVAALTLRLVENPVRFGFKGPALGLGAALSGGAAACCLVALVVPLRLAGGPDAPGLEARLASAADPEASLREALDGAGRLLPANLKPSLAEVRAVRSALYRDGCHADHQATGLPGGCVYGDPAAARTMVLFGDSHAAQWFPALEVIAREGHWRLLPMTKASCKIAEVTIVRNGGPYAQCDTWRAAAVARIRALRPSLVILSSSDAGDAFRPEADPRRQWEGGFHATFAAIGTSGAARIVVQDSPWPLSDVPDCVGEHPRALLAHCANRLPAAVRDTVRHEALRVAAGRDRIPVIDPAGWVCGAAGRCPPVVGDTLVYRDDGHLSERYARALVPLLARRLPP
ncbi:acyltransferase family protein [Actinocorallia longicatena]|uniref:SGNH hydrolase domain-containing protein n=1 Tax=Actinocorallia longicatena TaxID=111803 RepID=A0ABP6QNH0_9ACTN